MEHEAKKLLPKKKVLIALFAKSSNKCSCSDCANALFDQNGNFISHVAHIRGALPKSARYNEEMTNEERRAGNNLILLCPSCHVIVDADEHTYTTKVLLQMKEIHESRTKVGLTLSMEQIKKTQKSIENLLLKMIGLQEALLEKLNETDPRRIEIKYFAKKISEWTKDQVLKGKWLGRLSITASIFAVIFMNYLTYKSYNYEHYVSISIIAFILMIAGIFGFIRNLIFILGKYVNRLFMNGKFELTEEGTIIKYQMVATCPFCNGPVYLHWPPEREEGNHHLVGRCKNDPLRHAFSYSKYTKTGYFQILDNRPKKAA